MRFLIDNALSPSIAESLRAAGHDDVREIALQAKDDPTIFDRAAAEDRIIVSADTDFGFILSSRTVTKPSVLLFRKGTEHRPELQTQLLLTNLPSIETALNTGSIVVFERTRIRIPPLPLTSGSGT